MWLTELSSNQSIKSVASPETNFKFVISFSSVTLTGTTRTEGNFSTPT